MEKWNFEPIGVSGHTAEFLAQGKAVQIILPLISPNVKNANVTQAGNHKYRKSVETEKKYTL